VDPRLVVQRDDALRWLSSSDAALTASRLVRKYGLTEEPGDLLSEARVRISDSMSRRVSPLVGDSVDLASIRYAARSLSNVAVDFARRRVRDKKQEIELLHTLPSQIGSDRQVEAAVFIEELNSSVNQLVRSGATCPGCQREIVFAAATEVMQLVLIEGNTNDRTGGDDDWFDDAIQSVIDRLSPGSATSAARRKRRSRCKHCVMDLLSNALRRIGYRHG
jgi:hypothetical protein